MKTKKFLSFALVLAMLVGMLPGMSLTASAGGNTTTITPGSDEAKTGTGTMTITLHIHDFTEYKLGTTNTANDSIIATCKETTYHTDGQDYEAKLVIAAPTSGGGSANVTVEPEGAIAAPTVNYQTKQDNGEWGTETTSAPSASNEAAFYKASITLGEGDAAKTAYVTYGVNAISKVDATNGNFDVPSVATANATVTINTTPATGYELKTLTVTKAGGGTVEVTKDGDNGSFTMPEENVTVSAEFQKINYTISFDPMSNGTVAASKSGASVSAENPANYQDEITLTITPDDGFALKSLAVKDGENNAVGLSGTGNTRTFTMPASNVTVSATFEGAPFDVTISGTISGGTVTVASTLENGKAKAGSEVTLTVTPAAGYQLETLKYNNTTITASNGVYKFTMPAEAVTVTATFVGKDTTLTLSTEGNSGTACTASLLDSSYNEISSVTKKTGEEFILRINKDEGCGNTHKRVLKQK